MGQTLTASTTGISDADGLTNPAYRYEWVSDDTYIDDATSSTYTLQSTDNGKVIMVRVTFTDDAGYEESLSAIAQSIWLAIPFRRLKSRQHLTPTRKPRASQPSAGRRRWDRP